MYILYLELCAKIEWLEYLVNRAYFCVIIAINQAILNFTCNVQLGGAH